MPSSTSQPTTESLQQQLLCDLHSVADMLPPAPPHALLRANGEDVADTEDAVQMIVLHDSAHRNKRCLLAYQ